MRHPAGWFWPDALPWRVFEGNGDRTGVTGLTRATAESVARELGRRRRHRFGRKLTYAAPEAPR